MGNPLLGAGSLDPFGPIRALNPDRLFVADDLSGADSSTVGTWVDRMGVGDATQATEANKPLLRTGANGINGRNALSFDGSNDNLTTGTFAAVADATVFAVVKTGGSFGSNRAVVGSTGTGGSGNDVWPFLIGSTGVVAVYAGTTLNGDTLSTSTTYVVGGVMDQASSQTRVNGSTDAGNAGSNTLVSWRIGAAVSGGVFNGLIACVACWKSALGSTDRDTVESVLGGIYGVTVA